MPANRNRDTSTGGPMTFTAAVAADIDLLATHPYVVAGIRRIDEVNLPRRITVFGAGDLETEDQYSVAGALGTTNTIPIAVTPYVLDAGEVRYIRVAGTTCTNVLVQW